MFKRLVMVGALVIAGVSCSPEYKDERPPVDELDKRDKGLQSKDVVATADKMSMDLLALPELQSSAHKWLIVVDRVENRTTDSRFDLDIFIESLRVKIAQRGKGSVELIENRDKLRELQSRELEGGQAGTNSPGPAGIQPDYSLYGRIMELPNKGTSYYLCEFTLSNLRTREQVWTNAYEVKVAK